MNQTAIIIPANKRQAADDAMEARGYGRPLRVEMVPTTRTPKGEPPATHFGCNWQMSPSVRAHVETILTAAGITARYKDREPGGPPPFSAAMAEEGVLRVEREAE